MIHQLAGSNSYWTNPGVSDACNAAATGSSVNVACTVAWPNGASRANQTSIGPTQTAKRARYEAVVAAAVERNTLLAAALTSTVKTAVRARQITTRCTCKAMAGRTVTMTT